MKFHGGFRPLLLILWVCLLITEVLSQGDPTVAPPAGPAPSAGASTTGASADKKKEKEPIDEGLRQHFENLYKRYSDHSNVISSDCKALDSKDEDGDHHNWGTMSTLMFLAGKVDNNKLRGGEILMNTPARLNKLRRFLTRVGYLKQPGSLVFLDKQAATLRLEGCKEAVWRHQGEWAADMDYQERHTSTAFGLKEHAPSQYNYIHKYTCFRMGKNKCSHVFYVITKPLPDMPLGYMLREGTDMRTDGKDYMFTCNVPYCRIKECFLPGTDTRFPRRAYPPFTLTWRVPDTLAKKLAKVEDGHVRITDAEKGDEHHSAVKYEDSIGHIRILWDYSSLKARDSDQTQKDSYSPVEGGSWHNGFFEDKKPQNEGDMMKYAFHSRLIVTEAEYAVHSGSYECIIEDDNGIVSTPSHIHDDYRGRANMHVMPPWQLYIPVAVAVICVILVGLIIFICPKKMEHDDGTRYTKEEMVAPEAPPPVDDEMSVVASHKTIKEGQSAHSHKSQKSRRSQKDGELLKK